MFKKIIHARDYYEARNIYNHILKLDNLTVYESQNLEDLSFSVKKYEEIYLSPKKDDIFSQILNCSHFIDIEKDKFNKEILRKKLNSLLREV